LDDDGDRIDLEEASELNLVGGMFSGHGCGSFRGKCYSGIVEMVTGRSLYDALPNEVVREMADEMEKKAYSEDMEEFGLDEAGWNDLVKMFRLYADAGANLHAWY
jgi:hypothetical protein